jgi:hypothetical protein
MVHSIQKLAAGLAISAMLAGYGVIAPLQAEAAPQVGDVVGQVLATDIQAHVNGSTITSMNIDGLTAVVAEDLRGYGFDVAWIPQRKEVTIAPVAGKPVRQAAVATREELPVGQKLGDVYYTDIRATYEGGVIRSYNIGGKTAIVLNDLAPFGKLDWSEAARSLTFVPELAKAKTLSMEGLVAVEEQEAVKVKGIAIGATSVIYQGEQVGTVKDGMPYLKVEWIAGKLGYETVKEVDGAVRLNSGGYGITLRPVQADAERSWFGAPLRSVEQYRAPFLQGGVLYADEMALKEVMGYESVWSPETRDLDITYKTYQAEDYGIPESIDNYAYTVRMVGNFTGYNYPIILAENRMNGETMAYAISSLTVNDIEGLQERYKQSYISYTQTDIGSNELQVRVEAGNRPLYVKGFAADLTYRNVKPQVDTSNVSGSFLQVSEVTPSLAYAETSGRTFSISGKTAADTTGSLSVKVTREDNTDEILGTYDIPVANNTFMFDVPLPDEPGVYRVTLNSLVTFPRGTFNTPVAKWYVHKLAQP